MTEPLVTAETMRWQQRDRELVRLRQKVVALEDASSAGDAHWPCGDDRLECFRATHGQSVVKRLLDAGYLTVVQYRGRDMVARTEAGRDRYVAACNGEDHEGDRMP